jgi:hypothetical protein
MRIARSVAVALVVSCGGGRASPGADGAAGAQGTGAIGGGQAGSGGAVGAAGAQGTGAIGTGEAGSGGAVGAAGAGGAGVDARSETADAGFALDFAARAGGAIAAAAPPWTCATSLPTEPVADADAAREAVRQFIARVVGVPAGDITVTVQECATSMTASCASIFAHDTAKSGGAIYDTAWPLAQELEANANAIEVSIWTPMQSGLSLQPAVVMSGTADGLLTGLAVFNSTYPCH